MKEAVEGLDEKMGYVKKPVSYTHLDVYKRQDPDGDSDQGCTAQGSICTA